MQRFLFSGDRLNTTASNDSAVFNELELDCGQNEIVYEEIPETPRRCRSTSGKFITIRLLYRERDSNVFKNGVKHNIFVRR